MNFLIVLETLKLPDRWRVKVELSSDEASLMSTVFGVDVCSTEFIIVEELIRKLIPGVLTNQLREVKSGCTVHIDVSDIWLQSASPPGTMVSEAKQVLDYTIKSLDIIVNHALSLAKSLEDLRKNVVAPCLKSDLSSKTQVILEKLPLLCIRGLIRGETSLLDVIISDSVLSKIVLRLLIKMNTIPKTIVGNWYRGLQPRLEGCFNVVEGGEVYLGGSRFKPGHYYVNDCIVLEGFMEFCKDKLRGGMAESVKWEELPLEGDQRDIVEKWIQIVGGNVEVYLTDEWLYMRRGKAEGDVEYGELYIRIR